MTTPKHPMAMPERACKICGCTEDKACNTPAGPCHWIRADLCSACAFTLAPDRSWIRCNVCDLTSHHPEDVKNGYCGKCHEFHLDRINKTRPGLSATDLIALMELPPIGLELAPTAALHVLMALQLACRNADLRGAAFNVVVDVARGLQEHLSVSEGLAAMCEAGWPSQAEAPALYERGPQILKPGDPGFRL